MVPQKIITNNANCPTAQVDAYGHSIKTVTGATGDGTRRLHDSMNDGLSIWLYLAGIYHIGGCCGQKRTCKDFFSYILNCLSENDAHTRDFIQGMIPDLCVDGTGRELDEKQKRCSGTRAAPSSFGKLSPQARRIPRPRQPSLPQLPANG